MHPSKLKECLALFAASALVFTAGSLCASSAAAQEENLPDTEEPHIRIEQAKNSNIAAPNLMAAWQAYQDGSLDLAEQLYNEILHSDAQSRDALLGMAAIAQQRSRKTAAIRYYSRILALDPHDPYAHAGMIFLLDAGGAIDAESRLERLLTQHPETAVLHFALGNQFAKQSHWTAARQAYFNASELEPDNAIFALNLAISLDHLGQSQASLQHYRRSLQLDNARNAGFGHAQVQQRINELSGH